MWYLDKDVEENIIKNMEELGYPPDAVEYAGISNAGKHKFYYGTNLLTFSKQGDFIAENNLPVKKNPELRKRKKERKEQRKQIREFFKADYKCAKAHIETLLKEENPLFKRTSFSYHKQNSIEINLFFQSEYSIDKIYQIPVSFLLSNYQQHKEDKFTSYILAHIQKNSSIIEEQYRKAVIKDIPITKVYEDKNCSFIIQPTKKAYIYLKKADAQIPCKVDENECFFTKFIGSGIIRTPHIKLKCCDSIKEEMIQSACRKEVKLSNMQMNAVKNYVKNYEQWADKLLAAFAYPAGCGSYNVAPKCQIKGNDFSTVYVGSGIMIKDGKIHFINEVEKEFSKKRFQRAFFEAKELLKGYQYISGKGVLCGDTRIRRKISEFTINDTIHVPSYKESLVLWRKQLKREVKRINKAMDTMIKEKEKILFEKYNKLLSDFLLQDILKTVFLNNDYVTEKTVCSILRGTQLSNPDVKCTSNAGKYNILTIEEVSAAIKQLLKSELLEKKKIRGCYGSYNIVKLTPDGEKCINIIPFMKKGGSIDAVNKFNRMKKNEIDIKQYFILLDIIFKNPSFFCVYQYEVISVFANAPKEFFTLIKMRKSIEENRFRLKVYRMIVKK